MTRFWTFLKITHPNLAQNVHRQFVAFRTDIDSKYPRGVEAKDLFFHLPCEGLIVMLVEELVGNLKSSERFNLPLRRAIPDGVRSPKHVIDPERSNDLPN
jgi:hypothetical protein